MNTKHSLYIRMLLWAYKRHVEGFSESDLLSEFGLKEDMSKQKWYLKAFREHTLLLDYGGDGKMYLTAEGMSAAIDYLKLQEAIEGGERAQRTANWSIGIAAAVGVAQIMLAYLQISSVC